MSTLFTSRFPNFSIVINVHFEGYFPISLLDAGVLLETILQERRKELLFRGRRWADLKRLNLEAKFKKDLIRTINGQEYRLPFNSLKYCFQ